MSFLSPILRSIRRLAATGRPIDGEQRLSVPSVGKPGLAAGDLLPGEQTGHGLGVMSHDVAYDRASPWRPGLPVEHDGQERSNRCDGAGQQLKVGRFLAAELAIGEPEKDRSGRADHDGDHTRCRL
jgi:hypothetical protein